MGWQGPAGGGVNCRSPEIAIGRLRLSAQTGRGLQSQEQEAGSQQQHLLPDVGWDWPSLKPRPQGASAPRSTGLRVAPASEETLTYQLLPSSSSPCESHLPGNLLAHHSHLQPHSFQSMAPSSPHLSPPCPPPPLLSSSLLRIFSAVICSFVAAALLLP